MTRFYGAKSTVSVGLLCFILVIETSVVGNAFVFYTGFPRYVAFFACSGLVFLITYPFKTKSLNRSGAFLGLLILTALASDFFISTPHKLFVVKMLTLMALVKLCVNDYEYLRRSLGRTFLHASNLGILLGLSAILLPEVLVFDSGFLDILRRQGEGYNNTFYWSKNFSGLFLIGDEPNPLSILAQIPRYAGYFNEPAINGFFLCFSIALLFDSNYKFTKPVIILTATNFLLTFAISGFLSLVILLFLRRLWRSPSNLSLARDLGLAFVLALSVPTILSIEYIQHKLGGSLDGSVAMWEGVVTSSLLHTSSLNARVGAFNPERINLMSVFFWISVLACALIIFSMRFFSILSSKSLREPGYSELASNLWIIVVLVFSFKSLAHYLFMPVVFVMMAQIMFVDRRVSLEKFR